MRNSLFKKYVFMMYGVSLHDGEEKELIEYLSMHTEDIQDSIAISEYIYDYVKSIYNISPSLMHANDNSDLEQMLKLIKLKGDKK
ncbi:protein of unknown function [Petrocella atlantisensis]|uniref:Uncharacterized protein n=1 Tax=Petrocella atlantisensis TaxID=2173034 RepID=A0A3P7P1I5_9FIRM|nr:hypothetical protein [Petrocella atlantisensis]VDN49244.1 protein of unknown function [Petrocella atlantisensis]